MSEFYDNLAIGYVKEQEKKLTLSNNIPPGVINIICKYCHPFYRFTSHDNDKYIKDDGITATLIGDMSVTLDQYFKSNEYHKFCVKMTDIDGARLLIGVASTAWKIQGSYNSWNLGDTASSIIRDDGFYLTSLNTFSSTQFLQFQDSGSFLSHGYIKDFSSFWKKGDEIIVEIDGRDNEKPNIRIWNDTTIEKGPVMVMNAETDDDLTLIISSGWASLSNDPIEQTVELIPLKCA